MFTKVEEGRTSRTPRLRVISGDRAHRCLLRRRFQPPTRTLTNREPSPLHAPSRMPPACSMIHVYTNNDPIPCLRVADAYSLVYDLGERLPVTTISGATPRHVAG